MQVECHEENKENLPPRNLYYRDNSNSKTTFCFDRKKLGSHWTPRSQPPTPTKRETQKTEAAPQKSPNELIRDMFLRKNINLDNSKMLGRGHYSKVLSAVYDGTPIAIKVINTTKVTKEYFEKFMPREIECWKQLRHKNIVAVLGHYKAMHYVFLTMELGEVDLLSFVQKSGALPEAKGKNWATQIGSGLSHMHEHKIAHRDLKLENVIVFSGNVVKLADFGFAREVPEERRLSNTYCGSKSYAAPEILLSHPHNPFKADIWSLGVMFFIMLTDHMPFREDVPNRTIVGAQQKRKYYYPSKANLSFDCRSAIDTMLTFHWAERPNIRTVLGLPWFSAPSLV